MILLLIIIFIIIIILGAKVGSKEGKVYVIDKNIIFEPLYSRTLNEGQEEQFFGRHIREMIALKLGHRKIVFFETEFYILFLRNLFSFAKNFQEQLIQDFLAERQKVVIVNIGTKPGICSIFAVKFFSTFTFHYYGIDNPPGVNMVDYPNLKIFNNAFTESDAEKYKAGSSYLNSLFSEYSYGSYPNANPYTAKITEKLNRIKNKIYVLLVADYRSGTDETIVDEDLELQEKWVNIIKPDAMSLKFRLSWESGNTEYFTGDIYTQPRIGPSSTETRLVYFTPEIIENITSNTPLKEKSFEKKKYHHDSYNNRIFYWQRHNRLAFHNFTLLGSNDIFKKLAKGINGLCHCYDCWSEIEICKFFLQSFDLEYSYLLASLSSAYLHDKNEDDEDMIVAKIVNLMNRIGYYSKSRLDTPPHNLFVNERDINKKLDLLEQASKKYHVEEVNKFQANQKKSNY